MEQYNKWVLKQASTAQCSPALMAAALICAFVGVGYIYFKVILTTVLMVLAVVLSLVIVAGLGIFIRQLIRWNRKTYPVFTGEQEEPGAASRLSNPIITESTVASSTVPPQDSAAAIAAEADMLSDDVLELVWSPDGKTLIGRRTGK